VNGGGPGVFFGQVSIQGAIDLFLARNEIGLQIHDTGSSILDRR
jgi:hypothetical protein